MRAVATTALIAALAAGFYLLLIDTTDPPELYVMIGVVLIAVVAFAASRAQRLTEAAIAPKWLMRGWRPLARVPGDVAILTREAMAQLVVRKRGPIGSFRAIPFKGGEAENDYGRRALAEMLGSFAPNSIVIGVDTERELLLVHQLRREGGREELDVLRLG
jgi:hypothetical protein